MHKDTYARHLHTDQNLISQLAAGVADQFGLSKLEPDVANGSDVAPVSTC